MKKCEWCSFTQEERKWLISEIGHWRVFLADEQDYIGRCIIISERHCSSLSELNSQEWITLKNIIDCLEQFYKTVLGADLCNWSCLMNNFYKEENPNPHLHIHVRPRYKNAVIINNHNYIDGEFGHHYKNRKETALTVDDRIKLFDLMKEFLHNWQV